MPSLPPFLQRRSARVAAVVVALVLAVAVVGPWAYINFIREDPPDRLTLADAPSATSTTADSTTTTVDPSSTGGTSATTTATAASSSGIDGHWTVASSGNTAGYRAKEVLFGQDATAVGRTHDVTGSLDASGTTISAVKVVVDMTTVASDESRRDSQFHGRIMDTADFPTATFELTEPISLGSLPAEGKQITVKATGKLTLRGVTKTVTVDLSAVRQNGTIVVNSAIPIDFDDYDIPDASGGPASVGRSGEIELLVVFSR